MPCRTANDTSDPVDFFIVVGLAGNPDLYNIEADDVTVIVNTLGTPGTADDLVEFHNSANFTGAVGAQPSFLESFTLAALTNGLLVRGNANNNAITFDYSNGTPIPTGIGVILATGAGTDTIQLVNGPSITSVDHVFSQADRGSITTNDGSGGRVVNYIQMESPITDSLVPTTRSFTYSNSVDDITLADIGGNNGISQLSTSGTALTVNFQTPTGGTITVNTDGASGTANDTLHVNGFDSTIGATTLNGSGGSDLLVGAASSNTFAINAIDGGTLNTLSTFSSFENLRGGAAADTFSFAVECLASPELSTVKVAMTR